MRSAGSRHPAASDRAAPLPELRRSCLRNALGRPERARYPQPVHVDFPPPEDLRAFLAYYPVVMLVLAVDAGFFSRTERARYLDSLLRGLALIISAIGLVIAICGLGFPGVFKGLLALEWFIALVAAVALFVVLAVSFMHRRDGGTDQSD